MLEILISSDSASMGIYEGRFGPAFQAVLTEYLKSDWEPTYRIIPDDRDTSESPVKKVL